MVEFYDLELLKDLSLVTDESQYVCRGPKTKLKQGKWLT